MISTFKLPNSTTMFYSHPSEFKFPWCGIVHEFKFAKARNFTFGEAIATHLFVLDIRVASDPFINFTIKPSRKFIMYDNSRLFLLANFKDIDSFNHPFCYLMTKNQKYRIMGKNRYRLSDYIEASNVQIQVEFEKGYWCTIENFANSSAYLP